VRRDAWNGEGHTDRSRCALLPTGTYREPFTVNRSPAVGYLQAGSPSPAVVTIVFAVFTPMPQVNAGICECVTVADQ
jgi:hypothetical protein